MTSEDREKFLDIKDDNDDRYRSFKVSRKSIENMDEALIANINEVVGPDDELWHLGDFSFAKKEGDIIEYLNRINCENIKLVWGNHDNRWLLRWCRDYDLFAGYYESGCFFETDDGGLMSEDEIAQDYKGRNPFKRNQVWYFNHYPNVVWNAHHHGVIMLHGHCHGSLETWKQQHMPEANCFEVGVDCTNYKPFLLSDILTWKKKTKHKIDHHK